ncbi:hypothetical protein PIB30_036839 [Stylosanthes scabra]|uniref:Putative plant transposon protein domain-containing protein n=1 Tax=Stylosanthes scabra TaxID=79078 RepID=A0ABU6SE80_9FABA|nr:hypothetical protein [Stylosanthes scabra]
MINKSARWEITYRVARTKVTERAAERARTRAVAQEAARAAGERELTPFDEMRFNSRQSYEKSKVVFERQILNERIIHFNEERDDFMRQRIDGLGWSYMYNDLVEINITWVKEFYSHFSMADKIAEADDAYKRNVTKWKAGNLNMDMVLATISEPGMQWNSYNPRSGRVHNGILNINARGWFKMMVCNLKPLRHETTFSMETALLLYTLMDEGNIHLGRILNKSMYDVTEGAKDRRLAFPVMITKMAAAHNVPRYEDDDMYTVPARTRYCPFGDWKQTKRKARKADSDNQIHQPSLHQSMRLRTTHPPLPQQQISHQ